MTPAHTAQNFHDRKHNTALLIGVVNEGAQFTGQVEALQPYRGSIDIIIADGGSTDGSTASLAGKVRTLLVNTSGMRGLSVQYRIGLAYALEQGYDAIIMMDGNGKDGVSAIPRFLQALEAGADFVQGSRFLPGGEHINTPVIRVIGIRYIFNPIMYAASGYCYTDAMNGFKAVSRRFLEHPGLSPFRDIFLRYNLQYYLNYMAPRLGVQIREIPVSRSYRLHVRVQSKIVGARAWFSVLRELVGTVTGRYNLRP